MSSQTPLHTYPPHTHATRVEGRRLLFFTHYADLYGANLSLLPILRYYSASNSVKVFLPYPGRFSEHLSQYGIAFETKHFSPALTTPDQISWRRRFSRIRQCASLARAIRKWNPDLIYSNSAAVDHGAVIATLLRIRHIWHLREFGDADYGLRHDYGIIAQRYLLGRSTSTITNSQAINRHYRPACPSTVVYNGILSESDVDNRPPARGNRQGLTLGIVGYIHPQKGQDSAIRILAEYCKFDKNAQLKIIGSGDAIYISHLRSLASALGVEDRVHFTGYVERVADEYRDLDITLVCSEAEAFGRVIVESMAYGIPVLARRSGGVPEVISHNQTGLLYSEEHEAAQYLRTTLQSPEDRFRLATQGLETVRENFTIERYLSSIDQVVSSALATKG